ncbi:Uncharacterized protein AC502_5108 [Pseudomonas syringae pv. maculicola]|nr:Uncharacterized protein AC502_5108 [Pseudomonas syringae pv. maculicola]
MVGSSTPLGNALFRRQNIGFAIHNKRAVDHHCWDLRDPNAPGVYEVLLVALQALRIGALEALLHDHNGLLLIRWQSFRELGLKPF